MNMEQTHDWLRRMLVILSIGSILMAIYSMFLFVNTETIQYAMVTLGFSLFGIIAIPIVIKLVLALRLRRKVELETKKLVYQKTTS